MSSKLKFMVLNRLKKNYYYVIFKHFEIIPDKTIWLKRKNSFHFWNLFHRSIMFKKKP